MLDLYAGVWDGLPLGEADHVQCADEEPSIQARCRCHPTLPPGKARLTRIEHEYDRGGALTYLACWDVHRGRVFGRCAPRGGIEPFMALVEQVMTSQPYASAQRVFWIVDNGSAHRGQKATDRLTQRYPNAVMVHTPVHASWLNQVEIYFSIVQRKVLTPNDFTNLTDITARLEAFEDRYKLHRQPLQLALHQERPQHPARTPRRPRSRDHPDITPNELTARTTKQRLLPQCSQQRG